METFQYGEAGRQIYEFFWGEFCDWYLEISKIALYRGDAAAQARTRATLVTVLDESLRLLHPFIPYVTEETWGYLKQAAGAQDWPAALMIATWPTPGPVDPAAEADMAMVMEIVRAIRNARSEYNVQPGQTIAAALAAGDQAALLRDQAEILCSLARLDPAQLVIADRLDAPAQALTLVTGAVTTYLPMSGLVDPSTGSGQALDAERVRLREELAKTEAQLARSQNLLAGPFAQRAPADVVQRERAKQADLEARGARLRARLTDLAA